MPTLNTFAERLKHARKQARLTQKQLADRIGVSQAIISQLETGAYDKTVYAAQLAFACGVPAEWLAAGKNVAKRESLSGITVEKLGEIENNPQLLVKEWPEIIKKLGDVMQYLYKYTGDSMSGQSGPHIPSGALLTVNESLQPSEGSVILANISGFPAVGVYSVMLGQPYLRPSNPQYQAIHLNEGAVVGVISSYQVNFQ